jgi:uronate dehydrogenase
VTSGKHFDRLLLTGAAGNLGTVLRPRLAALAEVLRVSDVRDCGAAAAAEEVVGCDLADAGAVDALVAGVDAIVHLGGIATERSFQEIVRTNIEGTFNVYEAARRHRARRIVFASSNHAIGFYRQSEVIDAGAPLRPDSNYGLSKAFGENLARFYFDRYGIESVCLRIGSSFPEPADRRMLTTWLSYDDLFELVRTSLLTPAVGFTVVFGASANRDSWWNNRLAAHLNFAPRDNTERFRARIEAEQPLDPDDPAAVYHGGAYTAMGPFDEAFEAAFDQRGKPR